MARTLLLEIVTPDRLVMSREVESVTGAGFAGDFTILPGHVPFLSALRVGTLGYRLGGVLHEAFVGGGVADIGPGKVLILAEAAELPEEIDLDRAQKARDRAAARLEAARRDNVDFTRAKTALQRAVLRIKLYEALGANRPAKRPGPGR